MASRKKSKLSSFLHRYDTGKLVDIIVRASLSVFFAFTAGIYYRNALEQFARINWEQVTLDNVVQAVSILAGALYTMMIACLYVLRYKPINRRGGFLPTTSALLGGFLMFGLLWFKPNLDLPVEVRLVACTLSLVGNIGAFYVLTQLGRSFSILPESRKLVTKGPYNFVRHPLYVAEAISSLGEMMLFLSVGAVVIYVAQIFFQVVRIGYEEEILTETFPEYKKYAKRTSRFIPGIY